jgi:hypothetical protein
MKKEGSNMFGLIASIILGCTGWICGMAALNDNAENRDYIEKVEKENKAERERHYTQFKDMMYKHNNEMQKAAEDTNNIYHKYQRETNKDLFEISNDINANSDIVKKMRQQQEIVINQIIQAGIAIEQEIDRCKSGIEAIMGWIFQYNQKKEAKRQQKLDEAAARVGVTII